MKEFELFAQFFVEISFSFCLLSRNISHSIEKATNRDHFRHHRSLSIPLKNRTFHTSLIDCGS